jgi:hypothetical protein
MVRCALVKTHLFRIAAVASIAMLAVLVAGYFVHAGPRVIWGKSAPYRGLEVVVDRGRVAFWYSDNLATPIPGVVHLSWAGDPVRFAAPDVRRSLWEFDAHWLATGSGTQLFLLAFPIWLAAVPFLLVTTLWWRRRQGRKSVGFPVNIPSRAATE